MKTNKIILNKGEKPYSHFNRYKKKITKIQDPYTIKSPRKLELEGRLFKLVRGIYDQPTANIILMVKN